MTGPRDFPDQKTDAKNFACCRRGSLISISPPPCRRDSQLSLPGRHWPVCHSLQSLCCITPQLLNCFVSMLTRFSEQVRSPDRARPPHPSMRPTSQSGQHLPKLQHRRETTTSGPHRLASARLPIFPDKRFSRLSGTLRSVTRLKAKPHLSSKRSKQFQLALNRRHPVPVSTTT